MEVQLVVDIAYAMAGATGEAQGGGGLLTILPLILMFGIFYVLLIRLSKKRPKNTGPF